MYKLQGRRVCQGKSEYVVAVWLSPQTECPSANISLSRLRVVLPLRLPPRHAAPQPKRQLIDRWLPRPHSFVNEHYDQAAMIILSWYEAGAET